MIAVISPAKTLDFITPPSTEDHSLPRLLEQSEDLIKLCRKLSPTDLSKLMKISDKIAGLNVARFEQWQKEFSLDNAKQAILAFRGDVYTGLDADSLTAEELISGQARLRILSGLYGLLKPLDLIQPYRLEMGTSLINDKGNSLYKFWGDQITNLLNQDLAEQKSELLINLASNEYFKALQPKKINAQIITPIFEDEKNGQYKVISFYAKKARGMMARYIIENQLSTVDELKAFSAHGYRFNPHGSTDNALLFQRASADQ